MTTQYFSYLGGLRVCVLRVCIALLVETRGVLLFTTRCLIMKPFKKIILWRCSGEDVMPSSQLTEVRWVESP